MKWDRLKYFHIVSQTLNLKKASDIMNISHSSLSRQISVLENEMKIKLFFRKYSDYFKYIIIDDFHAKNPEWDKEKYIFSKNYITILNDFNYEVIEVKDSELPSSTAKKYAKRLIFKKTL